MPIRLSCFIFGLLLLLLFFKDHVVKSAAGHFAIKRLINQDKERLQLGSKGKVLTEHQKTKEQKY